MYTNLELENLRENEARLFSTFDLAAVGIAHVGLDGRILRVNRKFADTVGYPSDELLDLTFQNFTFHEDLERDVEQVKALIRGDGNNYTLEKRYVRKNGSLIWVELTVAIVRTANQPKYFISVIRDISPRKKVEQELQQVHLELEQRVELRTVALRRANEALRREMQEREFAQLERDNFFDLTTDCMAISDSHGYFRRVNPSICQLLGYTAHELTSRPLTEFIHPEDLVRTIEFREALLRGEMTDLDMIENRIIAKDGSSKWISWAGRNVPTVKLNYITGRNITERKLLEQEAEQQRAIMATNSKLNAIGLMASNMAHEINNPLTIIYGEGCLLQKMSEQGVADRGKMARMASNVVKMSERIVSIVNGLRALARDGESDPMECVPLRQVFEDTIPFCRAKISSKGIELAVEELVPEVFVCCRSVQLSQALLNLLNNAYDAVLGGPQQGMIRVQTHLSPSHVEIRVSDNGPGIPEGVRKKLFRPFVTSKVAGHGLGLGLSISKTMIEANGGRLFVDESAKNTTFVISLPSVLSE